MPFLLINDINVKMNESNEGELRNTMDIILNFSLKQDPNTHESIQLSFGGSSNTL